MSIIKIAAPEEYELAARYADKQTIVIYDKRNTAIAPINIEVQGADCNIDVIETHLRNVVGICVYPSTTIEPSIRDFIDFMESKLNSHRIAVDDCARELRDDFDEMLLSHREMDQDFLDRYNREVDKIKKLRWQHMAYERAIEWANDFLKNQTEQK